MAPHHMVDLFESDSSAAYLNILSLSLFGLLSYSHPARLSPVYLLPEIYRVKSPAHYTDVSDISRVATSSISAPHLLELFFFLFL